MRYIAIGIHNNEIIKFSSEIESFLFEEIEEYCLLNSVTIFDIEWLIVARVTGVYKDLMSWDIKTESLISNVYNDVVECVK